MDRPKFCVGEEVMIRSNILPQYNTDRTEILLMSETIIKSVDGWHYKTDATPDILEDNTLVAFWVCEANLRKIPHDKRTSMEEFMSKIKEKDKVT